jgi:ferritin
MRKYKDMNHLYHYIREDLKEMSINDIANIIQEFIYQLEQLNITKHEEKTILDEINNIIEGGAF